MINKKDNYVAWALLVENLSEAQEHLQKFTENMIKRDSYDESEFSAELGHIYAHLNRAWHSRNQTSEITSEQWPVFSQFPKDLEPVG
jgi:hypothetical protein